jgi:D-alanine-D-alanine ligase
MAAMDPEKYEIIQIGITHEGDWLTGEDVLSAMSRGETLSQRPAAIFPNPTRKDLYVMRLDEKALIFDRLTQLDVVFPVLHGTFGEDGTLQGMLEMADLAYVGAGVLGSAVAMDKGVCKDVLRAYGIPVVEWIVVSRSEIETDVAGVAEQARQVADFPLFVKPANLGSSVGVMKCSTRADLLEGLMDAARYDRRVLIERGVREAREIEISVLGNDEPRVSIPGEVIPSREFYSYESKYVDEGSQLLIPAPISPELAHQVQEMALKAYRAIDCAGMARVDFLLESGGPHGEPSKIYLSELNTIPGFTKISMYPKLWEASGLPYPALIDRLIDLALRRKQDRSHTERRYRKGV